MMPPSVFSNNKSKKMKEKRICLAFILGLLALQTLNACTIFIANDGKNVWVGNNEDDDPTKNYRLWFVPAKSNEHGYMVWGGVLKGLAEKMSHKFPEGGINEQGLFIDAAALPQKILIKKEASKKDWKGYIIRDILKSCKTVQEALAFISAYNLVEQEKAQIFVADATGDYAIVHANYVIKKQDNNFSLTNYCLNDGQQHICWRRSVVDKLLKSVSEYDLNTVKTALEKSAQTDFYNKTNFSIAANLKEGVIHLYQKNDFTTVKTLNVKEIIAKGDRSEDMSTFFPENITFDLEKTYSKKGIAATIEQYESLKNSSANEYNFHNTDIINFAIQLLSKDKIQDAKAVLNLQKEKTEAQLWLAIAEKIEKNEAKSSETFAELLKKAPQNYLYNMWGNQNKGKVSFYLNEFEEAQTVFLAGDFTEWKTKAIELKKENGVWTTIAEIPKGAHQYKFIVDGIWMTDPKNPLTATENKNVNSKLIVW